MPTEPRKVIIDEPFHVCHRGNNREAIFRDDQDRLRYLDLLQDKCQREKVDLLAHCLMTNHLHLVLIPRAPAAMARALGQAHGQYAMYFNRRIGKTGHLWGGRYRSCLLDRHHRWVAMAYVEQNPVRAHMVAAAVDWPWSSAMQHCLGRLPDVTLRLDEWRMAFTPDEWRAFLIRDRRADDDLLRVYTENGWALGESAWVERLEQICGRPLRPMPSGVHRLASSLP